MNPDPKNIPPAPPVAPPPIERPQVVIHNITQRERTPKIWKFLQLVSVIAAIAGSMFLTVGLLSEFQDGSGLVNVVRGISLLSFGVVGFVVASVCVWWLYG